VKSPTHARKGPRERPFFLLGRAAADISGQIKDFSAAAPE